MSDNKKIVAVPSGPRLGMSPRAFAREIFRMDDPEAVVPTLPAQAIYMAVQALGLESAGELLAITSDQQYKVLLDFDFWHRDDFQEERFWNWISVLDPEGGTEQLDRFVTTVDPYVLGIILGRNVEVLFQEEPSEVPPEPGFYTPDRGSTWLRILFEDQDRFRHCGRLLALIFEHNPEFFYQLLAQREATTSMEMVEDAFQDRVRRLADEGVPSHEASARIHAPMSVAQARALLAEQKSKEEVAANVVVPLVYSLVMPQQLGDLLSELATSPEATQELEAELALIANAALIFFAIDIADNEAVSFTVQQIRGCLNLGIERLEAEGVSPQEIASRSGLQRLYQVGQAELRTLKNKARPYEELPDLTSENLLFQAVIEAALLAFPAIPASILPDGSLELGSERQEKELRAASHLGEIRAAMGILEEKGLM